MQTRNTSGLVPLIPRLMRRARRLSPTPSEAEDMVQDTLLRICQRIKAGGSIDDMPAYAMRTLSNRAQQSWRRPKSEELQDDTATTLPDAPLRLDCADVLAAVSRLPEPQRALLEIIIEGETSPRHIAAQVGLPVGTVMSRLARARERLRKDLDWTTPQP